MFFDEKQIKILKGNFRNIASSVGCTDVYVSKVINNRVGNKRGGPKSNAVVKKANELLKALS